MSKTNLSICGFVIWSIAIGSLLGCDSDFEDSTLDGLSFDDSANDGEKDGKKNKKKDNKENGDDASGMPSGLDESSATLVPGGHNDLRCYYSVLGNVSMPSATLAEKTYLVGGEKLYYIRLAFDPHFVDNSYGANAIGWANSKKGEHKFKDLVGSDHAELKVFDANDKLVLQFKMDYISEDSQGLYPSDYGTMGVWGGDGGMIVGSASAIKEVNTSLSRNFNERGMSEWVVDSPPTTENYAPYGEWEFRVIYEVWIKASAFNGVAFGKSLVEYVHASPSKGENNTIEVTEEECGDDHWDSDYADGMDGSDSSGSSDGSGGSGGGSGDGGGDTCGGSGGGSGDGSSGGSSGGGSGDGSSGGSSGGVGGGGDSCGDNGSGNGGDASDSSNGGGSGGIGGSGGGGDDGGGSGSGSGSGGSGDGSSGGSGSGDDASDGSSGGSSGGSGGDGIGSNGGNDGSDSSGGGTGGNDGSDSSGDDDDIVV